MCGKVFGFVKRNLPGAKRRKSAASGERGAGKGAAALVPASAHGDPSAIPLGTLLDLRALNLLALNGPF